MNSFYYCLVLARSQSSLGLLLIFMREAQGRAKGDGKEEKEETTGRSCFFFFSFFVFFAIFQFLFEIFILQSTFIESNKEKTKRNKAK